MCVCVDIKQVIEYKKLYWKSMKQPHRMFLGSAACEHSCLHSIFSVGRILQLWARHLACLVLRFPRNWAGVPFLLHLGFSHRIRKRREYKQLPRRKTLSNHHTHIQVLLAHLFISWNFSTTNKKISKSVRWIQYSYT